MRRYLILLIIAAVCGSCELILGLEGDPVISGIDGGTGIDSGTANTCGDGVREPGEVCDDNNTASGDGCRTDCQGVEICGDDLLDFGEDCDDGNMTLGDGCRADCTPELCGDAIEDPGEICFAVSATLETSNVFTPFAMVPVAIDINGNGVLDIIASSNAPSVLVHFLGLGSGDFAGAVEQQVGVEGEATFDSGRLVMVDLDGTQGPDAYAIGNGGRLVRFQNDGAGGFGLAVSRAFNENSNAKGIAAGDVTGDGNTDLLGLFDDSLGGSLLLITGNGTLDLGAVTSFDIGNKPTDLAIADLNGDGLDDVGIASGDGELRILLATGTGSLSPQLPIAIPGGVIAVADVDGDGDNDLAVSAPGSTGLVVLRNNLDAGFASTSIAVPTNFGAGDIVFGDFDNDGDADLVVLGAYNNDGLGGPGGIVSYENDGSGIFQLGSTRDLFVSEGPEAFAITAADVDGDGVPEPIVSWRDDGGSSPILVLDTDH